MVASSIAAKRNSENAGVMKPIPMGVVFILSLCVVVVGIVIGIAPRAIRYVSNVLYDNPFVIKTPVVHRIINTTCN
jgi:hypothetical protein